MRSIFFSSTWQALPRRDRKLFGWLLAFHLLLCTWLMSHHSHMSDETDYFGYLIRWTHGHPERIAPTDDSKSPMVFPALAGTVLKWSPQVTEGDPHGFRLLYAGRHAMYGYLALTAFFMLLWLRRWAPGIPWLIPLGFFLLDPLVTSHALVVGTDVASMAFFLAICYTAFRFSESLQLRYAFWFILFSGLALVTKTSLVMMVVMLPILIINSWRRHRSHAGLGKKLALLTLAYAFGVLLIINAAYFAQGTGMPIAQWPVRSRLMQGLLQHAGFLGNIPSPLPWHFVSSVDALSYHAELGGGPNDENTYVGIQVLGGLQQHGSVWYYYLVAFLVKWPLLIWLLAGLSLRYRRRFFNADRLPGLRWVWLPAAGMLLFMSLRNPFQIGIRHALLLYPALYLMLTPAMAALWQRRAAWFKPLMMAHLISIAMFWPNLLAYSNELIWPKKKVTRWINDSSILYGNADRWVQEFVQKNPGYRIADSIPAPGYFAVNMEHLHSPYNTWGLQWLARHFEPVGLYKHAVLIYHISETDFAQYRSRLSSP